MFNVICTLHLALTRHCSCEHPSLPLTFHHSPFAPLSSGSQCGYHGAASITPTSKKTRSDPIPFHILFFSSNRPPVTPRLLLLFFEGRVAAYFRNLEPLSLTVLQSIWRFPSARFVDLCFASPLGPVTGYRLTVRRRL